MIRNDAACHTHKRAAIFRRLSLFLIGRDDWIRTSDLTHPKRARYQAAPRPVKQNQYGGKILFVNGPELLFRLAAQLLKLFVALLEQIENLTQLRSNLP
jgi:hypothetical protein